MRATYTRMFHDADGHSHLEEASLELELRDFAPPAEPVHIGALEAAASAFVFGAPPEWSGEASHPSPQRQLFCVMRGSVEVTMSDGTVHRFGAGDLILVEDTEGHGHRTRVSGDEDLVMFGVALAAQPGGDPVPHARRKGA
jgi:mannose-6-phosphate isomerase-like protein (cupin superfamily)